jgi:hypothetical protein
MLRRMLEAGVDRGLHPSWVGYRYVKRESVQEYFARRGGSAGAGAYETVHPEAVARNPLPRNIVRRDALPDDRGWWGYSFRDVPERTGGETFLARLPDCCVVCYRDPLQNGDFYPAILTDDGRALDLREIRFRPSHAAALRRSGSPRRLERATWIAERVYHNHSHWLTAHLPKLLWLRERGALHEVVLPSERTDAIDASLRLLGMDPAEFRTVDTGRPLAVSALTVLGTDRFRPELLQLVPQALGIDDAPPPVRRIFISRAGAARRRLVNEEDAWALLAPAGFERVQMEALTFSQQVALMKQTRVLLAPHGAGLTNMMFCPAGAHVVEMAALSFPNPNFYALASAMRHHYWLVEAEALGDVHPLEKDLRVDIPALARVVAALT